MLYLRARYYSFNTGRFISRDTYGGDYSSPQTLNRWSYVLNNPINFVDPTGHWCLLGRDVWPYELAPCTPADQANVATLVEETANVLRPVYANIYRVGTDPAIVNALPPEFWITGKKVVDFQNQQYAIVFSDRPLEDRIGSCAFVGGEAVLIAGLIVPTGKILVTESVLRIVPEGDGYDDGGYDDGGYDGSSDDYGQCAILRAQYEELQREIVRLDLNIATLEREASPSSAILLENLIRRRFIFTFEAEGILSYARQIGCIWTWYVP